MSSFFIIYNKCRIRIELGDLSRPFSAKGPSFYFRVSIRPAPRRHQPEGEQKNRPIKNTTGVSNDLPETTHPACLRRPKKSSRSTMPRKASWCASVIFCVYSVHFGLARDNSPAAWAEVVSLVDARSDDEGGEGAPFLRRKLQCHSGGTDVTNCASCCSTCGYC